MQMPNLVGHYRDGRYRRRVVDVSSASTGLVVQPKDSGTLFRIREVTTQMAYLPKISSGRLGLVYEFLVEPQSSAVNNFNIVTNRDSSARIIGVPGTSDSTGALVQSAAPDSTKFYCYGSFTAISSIWWIFQSNIQILMNSTVGEGLSTGVMGAWSTGTTSS